MFVHKCRTNNAHAEPHLDLSIIVFFPAHFPPIDDIFIIRRRVYESGKSARPRHAIYTKLFELGRWKITQRIVVGLYTNRITGNKTETIVYECVHRRVATRVNRLNNTDINIYIVVLPGTRCTFSSPTMTSILNRYKSKRYDAIKPPKYCAGW